MTPTGDLFVWLLLLIIQQGSAIFYNQPGFCSNATWNPNATTFFANDSIVGFQPEDIFIDIDNTIYITDKTNSHLLAWSEENSTLTVNISYGLSSPLSLFATTVDDIYISTSNSVNQVEKWTVNSMNGVPTMYTCDKCWDLFVDINNRLYCSMNSQHQVVAKSLDSTSNTYTVVAGNGTSGSASNMLASPKGIFVDDGLDIYVADHDNDRIQKFRSGESSAITIAGNGSASITITLNGPSGITLDADRYIYIVDRGNHRIVGSGPTGSLCLVGCSSSPGTASDQLSSPQRISFDSHGNMFVTDYGNNRVQKFPLMTDLCNTSRYEIATTENPTTSIVDDDNQTRSTSTTTSSSYKIPSYNQPVLNKYAIWSPDAITFANRSEIGEDPYSIFINENNTIYVADRENGEVQVWFNDSIDPTIISSNLIYPYSLFVTSDGDIYVNNGNFSAQVDKLIANTNTTNPVMYVSGRCFGLFIDITGNLYCSMVDFHQVVVKSLTSNSNQTAIVAGTGCPGSSSHMLNQPHGIFVDTKLNLYVADCQNNRIQLFQSGQLTASPAASSLLCPTGIVLDSHGHLYIADKNNHRIIRSSPDGYQCIGGCTNTPGSASNQLSYPTSLSFDSYGNIFVADSNNSRIQKFILMNNIDALSYNQPKFCSNASWNPNATTVANKSVVGSQPHGIFIDTNNMIYVGDLTNNRVEVWFNDSNNLMRTISGGLNGSYSVFVTTNGDVYVDNGGSNGRVDKWSTNASSSIPVMYVNSSCYGIFVDISNTLYCSIHANHQVVKRWLNDSSNTTKIAAGLGSAGNTSNMLHSPRGIFVDVNFDLYVADQSNDRIQLFKSGELNATTIAGNESATPTITLNNPSGVALDADKYLFIVDHSNNRIVRSGPSGSQCVAGCSRVNGSASNQLSGPTALSFDTDGNIFVTDRYNSRIQKFIFMAYSCNPIIEVPTTTHVQQETTMKPTSTMISTTMEPTSTMVSTTVNKNSTTTMVQTTTVGSYSTAFVSATCLNSSQFGMTCNIFGTACDILQPCQNNATCLNINTTTLGFACSCSVGFSGIQCQIDNRPCKPTTCWNNGTCMEISNTTFNCNCTPGWEGVHCEIKVNYCANVTCMNNGVCRPLLGDYKCECLGVSYSGRHCEIVANSRIARQAVCKSFGYVAIIFLIIVVVFIIIMDVLKYCFGIDPARRERGRFRGRTRRRKRPSPIILRFIYVHSSLETSSETVGETDS